VKIPIGEILGLFLFPLSSFRTVTPAERDRDKVPLKGLFREQLFLLCKCKGEPHWEGKRRRGLKKVLGRQFFFGDYINDIPQNPESEKQWG